jgi:small subunit ribosomal protein S9
MAEKKAKDSKKTGIFTVGKRRKAVARATIKPGKGTVKINNIPLDVIGNEMNRLRMQEPLILVGDDWKKFDIRVNVKGGGSVGQSEAARQAIARALVEMLGAKVKEEFTKYDRNLLVFDPRRTEPHKPPHSSWGARRYKQRSKR